jgi:SAM-dependent methyltransferase
VNSQAARHFDRRAAGYQTFRRSWPLAWLQREEERALQKIADVAPGQLVLDVGCGAGSTLDWLRGRRTRAVGVDLSRAMAHACHDAGHAVAVQDMEALGLRPAFDWVLCVGSLEFVSRPEQAIRNLAACVRAGGALVLLFPRRGVLGSLYRLYHRSHGVRVHLFRPDEIEAHGIAAGLGAPDQILHCRLSSFCRMRLAATG